MRTPTEQYRAPEVLGNGIFDLGWERQKNHPELQKAF